ncbi:adhesion protein FadA [Leptotrichia sp. oral taxon 847]|uniref:adhesion protein FadA n=1 Tax=Leptotrichia sp. oral taxon 847 TaxID=1785996 RepID=UPI000767E7C4|nr:adhesion protein FadA [Leptotrichia sp. oral taxon 847]AMD95269.1 adhesion protein FadA [Leptotrichia sp. oral taxon 847]
MKKKLAILLGVIALSSMSFGATTKTGASSIENSLNNLEKQLTDLQKMEDQKYAQEEAKAAAAQQKIDEYSKIQATIDERISTIESTAETSIFGKEFKSKISEYKALRNQLDKEIANQQKIIDNFELLKSLR